MSYIDKRQRATPGRNPDGRADRPQEEES